MGLIRLNISAKSIERKLHFDISRYVKCLHHPAIASYRSTNLVLVV